MTVYARSPDARHFAGRYETKTRGMTGNAKNIFAVVLGRVHAATDALVVSGKLPSGLDKSRIVVEPPKDASHGDMATNIAMVLAKPANAKPRELAEAVAEVDGVLSVEVEGIMVGLFANLDYQYP